MIFSPLTEISADGFLGFSDGVGVGVGFSFGVTGTSGLTSFGGGFLLSLLFWAKVAKEAPTIKIRANKVCFKILNMVTSSSFHFKSHAQGERTNVRQFCIGKINATNC